MVRRGGEGGGGVGEEGVREGGRALMGSSKWGRRNYADQTSRRTCAPVYSLSPARGCRQGHRGPIPVARAGRAGWQAAGLAGRVGRPGAVRISDQQLLHEFTA